jgi:hypothetical protein
MIRTIEEYLAAYVPRWIPTRTTSTSSVGCCIFHDDRHPSMVINHASSDPDKHWFNCLSPGCRVNGAGLYGIVRWVEFGGRDDNDTRHEIALRVHELRDENRDAQAEAEARAKTQERFAAVTLQPDSGEQHDATQEEMQLMTAAFDFWRTQLWHTNTLNAQTARHYLAKERGVSLEWAKYTHTVGYAPPMPRYSSLYGTFCAALEERCGKTWKRIAQQLGILNDQEQVCVQHRLMFANYNWSGNHALVTAYQGRTLSQDEKAQRFYKFVFPRGLIKRPFTIPDGESYGYRFQGTVLLESYIGVLQLSEPNARAYNHPAILAFAEMGTGPDLPLETWSQPIYLCHDHDRPIQSVRNGQQVLVRPGDELAHKRLKYCREQGITQVARVRVPQMYKDPDTFIRQCGLEAFLALLLEAEEALSAFIPQEQAAIAACL